MNKHKAFFITFLLVSISILVLSCDNDSYVYPPVRFELVDAVVSENGKVLSVMLGDNSIYQPEEEFVIPRVSRASTVVVRGVSHLEFTEDMSSLVRIYNFSQIPALTPVLKAPQKESDPFEKLVRVWFTNDRYVNLEFKYRSLDDASIHKFGVVASLDTDLYATRTLDLRIIHDADNDLEGSLKSATFTIDLKDEIEDASIQQIVLSALVKDSKGYKMIWEYNK